MVNGQAALRHDLLQVAIGERVSQLPADAEEDDHVFEVSSAEQCWPFSGHDIPYQITSSTFCNRTGRTTSPPIHISSRRMDLGWEFSVQDNGFGMASAFQGRRRCRVLSIQSGLYYGTPAMVRSLAGPVAREHFPSVAPLIINHRGGRFRTAL